MEQLQLRPFHRSMSNALCQLCPQQCTHTDQGVLTRSVSEPAPLSPNFRLAELAGRILRHHSPSWALTAV